MGGKHQKTYIEGLDMLLGRGTDKDKQGIKILDGKPLDLLIKGYAGSGKTTLSFQIAVNIFKNEEKSCIYFYSDQTPKEIAALLSSFNWNDDVNLYSVNQSITTYEKCNTNGGGDAFPFSEPRTSPPGIYLYDLAHLAYDIKNIRKKVTELSRKMPSEPMVIIIDSLNIMENVTAPTTRSHIRAITASMQETDSSTTPIFIFTYEKDEGPQARNLNYYFNMVIDLDEHIESEYLFKTIQIEKARNQEHALGRHQYKINTSEGGLSIIPSLHFILSEYKSVDFHGEEIINIGTEGLGEMLKSDSHGNKGILEKSATIVMGETGARKSPLALNFLCEGTKSYKLNETIIDRIRNERAEPIGFEISKSIIGEHNFLNRLRVELGKEYVDTHKKSILSQCEQPDGGERVLFLSLRDDESNVIATMKGYGLDEFLKKTYAPCGPDHCTLKVGFDSDYSSIKKMNKPVRPFHSLFKIMYFRPGFISPDDFVNKILKVIKEYESCKECSFFKNLTDDEQKRQLEKVKFKRVVLDDIAQFDLRFPVFAKNPILLPTLIDVFKSEGITSMFIDIIERGESPEKKRTLAEIVDNILIVRHLSFYGKNRTGISVGRLHGGVYESDFREVCVEKRKINQSDEERTVDFIRVTPNFDRFVNLESSEPIHAPLEISLYEESFTPVDSQKVGEAKASQDQKTDSPFFKYNELIKRSLTSVFEEKIEIKRITRKDDENYHFGILKKREEPLTSTKVVTIDEFWVDTLIDHKHGECCLIDLENDRFKSGVFEGEENFENLFIYKEYLKKRRKKYVIPYFLNMQLLCFDIDLLKEHLGNDSAVPWKKIEEKKFSEIVWDWKTIKSLINKISTETRTTLFTHYRGQEHLESMNCLFLDLLWSRGVSETLDLTKYRDNELFRKEAIQNIKDFHSIAIQHDEQGADEGQGAIFWISWYSDLIRKIREKKEKNIGIAPLPNGGMSGEWYIGVMNGSVSPIVGIEAIKYITSIELDREVLNLGVGLPSRRRFYYTPFPSTNENNREQNDNSSIFYPWGGGPLLSELLKIFEKTRSRSQVKNYINIRSDLEIFFRKLMSAKEENIETIFDDLISVIAEKRTAR